MSETCIHVIEKLPHPCHGKLSTKDSLISTSSDYLSVSI